VTRGTTLYLRALPEDLVREVKAIAARRGMTLTALVTEALRHLVEREHSPGDHPIDDVSTGDLQEATRELEESMRWFAANRSRLLRRYRNQYIAIYRKRVIDHDHDFDALARRVFARLGAVPVCMPKVTSQERIVHIPSPRLAEA